MCGAHLSELVRRLHNLFNELGFTKLFLRTQPSNTEACGLAEKLGFEKEGLLHGKCAVHI